jgi:hypothetical protein
VALVDVVQGTPNDSTFTPRQGGGPYSLVKTLYPSNVVEVFKSVSTPPSSIDIELIGGKRDRGDYIEDVVNERTPPLKTGARYIVFLRAASSSRTYVPATSDASSFFRLEGATLSSTGKSDLAHLLAKGTQDELIDRLSSREVRNAVCANCC